MIFEKLESKATKIMITEMITADQRRNCQNVRQETTTTLNIAQSTITILSPVSVVRPPTHTQHTHTHTHNTADTHSTCTHRHTTHTHTHTHTPHTHTHAPHTQHTTHTPHTPHILHELAVKCCIHESTRGFDPFAAITASLWHKSRARVG